MIIVPKGTRPSRCRGATCGRTDIYWVEQRSQAKKYATVPENKRPTVRIPVDCAVPGGSEPDSLSAGKGETHFGTCPDSNDF